MSFGWSAGDIAAAIALAYNLIQALDTCDGAAGDYREAVSFLRDLKRTLEPLQAFTASNVVPGYGNDIQKQVTHIKEPVEVFLAAVLKYEPSLGAAAKEGHHRHIFRKLQWYMFMSKKVLSLRKKIESHMRIIDTLMHRLTIDSIRATQQQLPDVLRATLQQTLRPELIAVLQENLPPLNTRLLESYCELQTTNPDMSAAKLTEQYQGLSLGIKDIRKDIRSSRATQMRIESCLRGHIPRRKVPALLAPAPEQPCRNSQGNEESMNQSVTSTSPNVNVTHQMVHESLREVYYLVFLYLGHFVRNLFLVLSRLVQPTEALMPVLLARYNISFLDAFGRPPRILPFEYFRSFKVLQAFIQHEFKDFPGSSMVDRGKYLVLNFANSLILDERNWSGYVAPGSTIAMSMVVRKRLELSDSQEDRCPEPSCPGTWTKSETQAWATCPVCQKQILNFPTNNLNDREEIAIQRSLNRVSSRDFAEYEQGSTLLRPIHPIGLSQERDGAELELEDDISFFKRIVQEITDLRHNPSEPLQTLFRVTLQITARCKLFMQRAQAFDYLVPEPSLGSTIVVGDFIRILDRETSTFVTVASRLLPLAPNFSLGSSSVEFPENPMNYISENPKPRLGLDLYKLILEKAKAICQFLHRIGAQFLRSIEKPDGSHFVRILRETRRIARITANISTLKLLSQNFEKLVILAEDLARADNFPPSSA